MMFHGDIQLNISYEMLIQLNIQLDNDINYKNNALQNKLSEAWY